MTVKSFQEWEREGYGKFLYHILDIKGNEYYATSNIIYALNQKVICCIIEDNGFFFSYFYQDPSSSSIGMVEGDLVTRIRYLAEHPKQIKKCYRQSPIISSRKSVLFCKYEINERYIFEVTNKCDAKGNQILKDSSDRLHLLTGTNTRYEDGDEVKCTVIDLGRNLCDLIPGEYLILSEPRIVNKVETAYKKKPEEWYNEVSGLEWHKCGKPFRCNCCAQNYPANAGVRVDFKEVYFCNSCAKKIFEPKARGNKRFYILTPMGNKR